MTNQVQSDPGASALFAAADGRKPQVMDRPKSTRAILLTTH